MCACAWFWVFASVKRNARLEGESISIFAIYFCTIAGCSTVFETENDRQNERAGRERGQWVEKGLLILLCCWGRIYLQGKSVNSNAPEIQAGLSFFVCLFVCCLFLPIANIHWSDLKSHCWNSSHRQPNMQIKLWIIALDSVKKKKKKRTHQLIHTPPPA